MRLIINGLREYVDMAELLISRRLTLMTGVSNVNAL